MGYKDDNYSTKVCGHHPETCTCRDWDTKEEVIQVKGGDDIVFPSSTTITLHKYKQETTEMVKDLAYWKENAEEDYIKVPISVLRYISELEKHTQKDYSPLPKSEDIVTNLINQNKLTLSEAFYEGIKWEQDKHKDKYSEEEVRKLFNQYKEHFNIYRNMQILNVEFDEWFNQFKKK